MVRGRKSAAERRRLADASPDPLPPGPTGGSAALAQVGGDLASEARARLEEWIVTLELKPGTVWSEAELSARLGIGRTPVREALKSLESDHLVSIEPRHGAKITEIDVLEQLLMLEMRRELERLVAVSAARRATPTERAQCLAMSTTLRGMKGQEVLQFLRFHYNAKRFLVECARNRYLERAIAPCHAMSRRFYYLHYQFIQDVSIAAGLHALIFQAVALGDEAAAATASNELMNYAQKLVEATVTRSR